MAGEQIPVVHDVTGDETTMPVEALDAWAERGWHPKENDWRERYGVQPPSAALTVSTDASGNVVESPPPSPPG